MNKKSNQKVIEWVAEHFKSGDIVRGKDAVLETGASSSTVSRVFRHLAEEGYFERSPNRMRVHTWRRTERNLSYSRRGRHRPRLCFKTGLETFTSSGS